MCSKNVLKLFSIFALKISDDEDDVHPNIDTPSLFRWRHQARVERMEELEREKAMLQQEKERHQKEIEQTKAKAAQAAASEAAGDTDALKKTLSELEKKSKDLALHEKSIETKERKAPWNVDTISKPAFSKTIINTKAIRPAEENLSEEEREANMKKFVRENEKLLKQYGMLQKYDDSKRFLMEHTHLSCENTANYLVIWCINLEMEGKTKLMEHVAHQSICMQFILELAKQLDLDPRGCVSSFFSRIQVAEPEYRSNFESEVTAFKTRIQNRAKEKLAEAEEEERLARLGPGGLDPMEVFESLPEVCHFACRSFWNKLRSLNINLQELQKCFESRDIPMLQAAIAELPPAEARYHLKRCVDSGLWVPEGGVPSEEGEDGTEDGAEGAEPEEEEIYHEAKSTVQSTTDDVD